MNIRRLGFCAVGNFDLAPPPPAMWVKLIDLTASLCTVFEIRVDHVVGHREYATYKSCPGKLFDMDMFRQEVRRQL
jgi:N-acetyl-anhydromuramyl-L-alanine amidase AmpD